MGFVVRDPQGELPSPSTAVRQTGAGAAGAASARAGAHRGLSPLPSWQLATDLPSTVQPPWMGHPKPQPDTVLRQRTPSLSLRPWLCLWPCERYRRAPSVPALSVLLSCRRFFFQEATSWSDCETLLNRSL